MKRPLVLLLAVAITMTLVGVAPAAAGADDCNAIGASASTFVDANQVAVQVAVQNNIAAGIVAIDFGDGDATTIVDQYSNIDQDVYQDVC